MARRGYSDYSHNQTFCNTPRWHVRKFAGGEGFTMHDKWSRLSIGLQGDDAYAVAAYFEATRDINPTVSIDVVCAKVWHDFGLEANAFPEPATSCVSFA